MGINPFVHGSAKHTDIMKTEGLKQALNKYGFDAAFGGARRDEEKSRAKERIYSFRDRFHRWDPKTSGRSCGTTTTARSTKGRASASSRCRTGPSWTSGSTSSRKRSTLCRCTAKPRPVVERDGMLMMVDDDRIDLQPGEVISQRMVRFRTPGAGR